MARWRRGTSERTAEVPGQRSEPVVPPDAHQDDAPQPEPREATDPRETEPRETAPDTPAVSAAEGRAAEKAAPGDTPTVPTEPVRPAAGTPETGKPEAARPEAAPTRPGQVPDHKLRRTRLSGTWLAVVAFAVILVFLLIFILQNSNTVEVSYLGAHGHIGLGVALLFAAVGGVVLTALAGSARIMQLRATARKHRRADARAAKEAAKADQR